MPCYQPGDEQWVRKFELTNPNVNPLEYEPWAKSADGEMTRMMLEMLDEMMPMMMANMSGHSSNMQHGRPQGSNETSMKHEGMSHEQHQKVMSHDGLSPQKEHSMSQNPMTMTHGTTHRSPHSPETPKSASSQAHNPAFRRVKLLALSWMP